MQSPVESCKFLQIPAEWGISDFVTIGRACFLYYLVFGWLMVIYSTSKINDLKSWQTGQKVSFPKNLSGQLLSAWSPISYPIVTKQSDLM